MIFEILFVRKKHLSLLIACWVGMRWQEKTRMTPRFWVGFSKIFYGEACGEAVVDSSEDKKFSLK